MIIRFPGIAETLGIGVVERKTRTKQSKRKIRTIIINTKTVVLMTFEGIKHWRGYATYLHNDSRRY